MAPSCKLEFARFSAKLKIEDEARAWQLLLSPGVGVGVITRITANLSLAKLGLTSQLDLSLATRKQESMISFIGEDVHL